MADAKWTVGGKIDLELATGEYTADIIRNRTNAAGTIKLVPGEMAISIYSNGDSILTTLTKNQEINHELICVRFTANNAEDLILNKIGISLNYLSTASDNDFTNARIFMDLGNLGTYDNGTDILIGVANDIVNGKVIFDSISGFTVQSNSTNFVLLLLEHNAMSSGEGVTGIALTNYIEFVGLTTVNTDVSCGSAISTLKKVPGSIVISSISNGDVTDFQFSSAPETRREIFALNISGSAGESITLSTIKFSLFYENGASDSDITNVKLFIDNGTIGTYEAGIDIVLIDTNIEPQSGIISFTNISGLTINELGSKNVLLIFDHLNMLITEKLTPIIKQDYVIGNGLYTGESISSTTTVTGLYKEVGGIGEIYITVNSNGDSYNERFLTKAVEYNKDLISFRVSATAVEERILNKVSISLIYNDTAVNSDFTNARLYYDTSTVGTYSTETSSELISTVVSPTGGWITFDNISGVTISSNWGTNFIVVIDHKILTHGEGLTAFITTGAVESYGKFSTVTNSSIGTGSGVLKKVPSDLYVFNNNSGDVANNALSVSTEYDRELFAFKISVGTGDMLA